MRPIPGDESYGAEVVAPDIRELSERITADVEQLRALGVSVDAIAKIIDALDLATDEAVHEALQSTLDAGSELLDTASNIFEKLMDRAGVSVEPVVPAKAPKTTKAAARTQKPADSVAEVDKEKLEALLPPQLRSENLETARRILGTRVFGLGGDELRDNVALVEKATAQIGVSEDGRKLTVIEGKGMGKTLTLNSEVAIRAINMYMRLLVANQGEFKKSDVDSIFGTDGGFSSLSVAIARGNDVVPKRLETSPLFKSNGQDRSRARYTATGHVIFLDETNL